ncbi:MAG: DUF2207 domain-containing protein, partial [Pseudomonadota bacterium]
MRILAATLIFLSSALGALAQEAVLLFDSNITVNADGSLLVRETIRVNAEGRQIRRGIVRDFPTVREENGREVSVPFSVQSVTRDGRAENFAVERGARAARVRIGNADVFLQQGIYEYVITYSTDRQLRFFENYDELFWNVTGNFWDFPINNARATVVLPQGTPVTDIIFFTGRFGSTERNATGAITGQNSAEFRTTRTLNPGEGLTIGVKFPTGFIAAPDGAKTFGWWLRDNLALIIAYGGLAVVLAYYFWGWDRVGRDPPSDVVVPRWDLPDGVSPALAHYVENKGLKGKGFTAISAAAVSLAVKGLVSLDKHDGDMTITRTEQDLPGNSLPTGEKALLDRIGLRGGSLTLNKANGKSVLSLANKFTSAMEKEHRSVYYKFNSGWIVFGAVLSIAVAIGTVIFARFTEDALALIVPTGFIAIFASIFIPAVAKSMSGGIAGKIQMAFILMFLSTFAFGTGSALFAEFSTMDIAPFAPVIGAMGALLVVNVVFFFLMG